MNREPQEIEGLIHKYSYASGMWKFGASTGEDVQSLYEAMMSAIDRLIEERDELVHDNERLSNSLTAEVNYGEALLRDALRYRWLRERLCVTDIHGRKGQFLPSRLPLDQCSAEPNDDYEIEVDAAIDAAAGEGN